MQSSRRRVRPFVGVALLGACLLVAGPAVAQEAGDNPGPREGTVGTPPADAGDTNTDPDSAENPPRGFWSRTGAGIKNIWTTGGSDVYVPGYIWHLPYNYSEEQIDRYNTAAWGLGYGRTLRSNPNRPRTLYAIVSADSYANPQYMLGYAWRARWRPGGGAFSLSGGYSVMVVGREDKGSYAPLPFALPLGSIGTDRFELMGAYVPYFEVGYFFLRLNLGSGRVAGSQK